MCDVRTCTSEFVSLCACAVWLGGYWPRFERDRRQARCLRGVHANAANIPDQRHHEAEADSPLIAAEPSACVLADNVHDVRFIPGALWPSAAEHGHVAPTVSPPQQLCPCHQDND